jgi:hypothetical protein
MLNLRGPSPIVKFFGAIDLNLLEISELRHWPPPVVVKLGDPAHQVNLFAKSIFAVHAISFVSGSFQHKHVKFTAKRTGVCLR